MTKKKLRKMELEFVKIYEEPRADNGRMRYRTACRRKEFEPYKAMGMKPVEDHDTWNEACDFGMALDRRIRNGEAYEPDKEMLKELERLAKRVQMREEFVSESNKANRDVVALVNLGLKFAIKLEAINKKREAEGLSLVTDEKAFDGWTEFETEKAKPKNRITFVEVIDACLVAKTGKYGAAGGGEMQEGSKDDWKRLIGCYLKEWIGSRKLTDDKFYLTDLVFNGISQHVNRQRGKGFGQPWSPRSKWACAVKVSEFGNWLEENPNVDYRLPVNPFKTLPKKFKVKKNTESTDPPKTYSFGEVKRIFDVAIRPENREMIPYFAIALFAGCRSEEIAGYKVAERRLQWSQFKGWKQESHVTGGMMFHVPPVRKNTNGKVKRASKVTDPRYADLVPVGVEWIKWYFSTIGETLPTSGSIFFSARIRQRILKEAGVFDPTERSIHRRTFASHAHQNVAWPNSTRDYWLEKCGHDLEAYRNHYKDTKTHSECADYFAEILPPEIKKINFTDKPDETGQFLSAS
jgi:hypothetical protein